MMEGWRAEINIAHEEKRALIRPGSGDVIVNYHPLTHLHHTHTHTHTHTQTIDSQAQSAQEYRHHKEL